MDSYPVRFTKAQLEILADLEGADSIVAKAKEALVRLTRDSCFICGTVLDGNPHSCPFDRADWEIGGMELGPEQTTGKVVTPEGEFIVQWSENRLLVLRDDRNLEIRPICGNAVSLSVFPEEEMLGDGAIGVSFGEAVSRLRKGTAMARQSWVKRKLWIVVDYPEHEAPRFMIEDGNSEARDRWQPSHTDMLATDWVEVERPEEAQGWQRTR